MNKIKAIMGSLNKLNWKMKAIYILLGILLIFFINIAIAPLNKIKEFKQLVISDTQFIKEYDSTYDYPEMSAVVKEKAYKKALLKLTESDSFQLVVNLSDSSVNLFIRGVPIHCSQIKTFKADRLFETMPMMHYVKLFSQPLPVYSLHATIVKEPIVVRHAPKDTLEAALDAWQPDTLIQKPAFLILSVAHGIEMIFEQENNPAFYDIWKKFNFYNRLRLKKSFRAFINFISFKKQEYHTTITIKLSADDLRAIYRALPNNAFVVLKVL